MKNKTKKEIIYEALKDDIYNRRFKFNEKLVISILAKRFNSSEIPVREALNQLQADGIIDIKPHVGAVVKPLSLKDVQNIFEIRIELEGLATRLASDGLTEEDFDYLRMILDASIGAFEREEYSRFAELNKKFHKAIYLKSGNELLTEIINDLWRNNNRYPSLFNQNHDYIQQSIKEHEKIYHALCEKDGLLAENLMIQHKARAEKEIMSITQKEYYKNLQEENK